MKKCRKCKKKYNDEVDFCIYCGKRLSKGSNNVIVAVVIVIIIIIAMLGIGISLLEQKKIHDTKQAIEDYKYQKMVKEYKSTPTLSDIVINDDWAVEKDGSYLYIRGSVTNISSSKIISYFEVEAKFFDSKGNVIDSDWTNDGRDLEPGETRQFEIMHKNSGKIYDIKLSIKDVK